MTRERTPRRLEKIKRVLAHRQKDLRLILSNIHDPHNVSAIYRSCDAFGVPKVHLHYTNTAFPVLGKKSSGSARKWVESERHNDAVEMIGGLKEQGFQVLATGFSEKARPINEWDFTIPTAVILGNEHDGVEKELTEMATGEIYIPMQGMVQSLNVSVAAAVTLFEAWRQRNEKGMFDSPSYTPEELDAFFKEWSSM